MRRDSDRLVPIRASVTLPTAAAVLAGRDEAQQRVADGLLRGATTVDELVAVTTLSVGGVLGALTRLEASGLVRANRGRYEPLGALAGGGAGTGAARVEAGCVGRTIDLPGAGLRRATVPAVIRAILHLLNDQPLVVDLLEAPHAERLHDRVHERQVTSTASGRCSSTSPRRRSSSRWRWSGSSRSRAPPTRQSAASPAAATAADAEDAEDLEIDEDFLRRVREA